MTNIKIKHAGKVYDLAVDPEESGLTLKLQVSSLTNVPPDRQKILAKGGPLKDDAILGSMFKEGQTVMMLGTPLEEVIKADDVNVKFIEDGDSTGLVNPNLLNLPSGLINLGNTCYLNSSIQVLYTVDELKRDLQNFHENDPALIKNMKELFEKLKNSNGKEVTPLNFLASVRNTFPQFQERSREGFYKQQDAEEAYSQILNAVISKFPDLEKYMKVEMKSETKCLESGGQDDVKYDFEDSLKLSCHINNSTNFMIDGLKNGLKETIEKNNESLGRNAQYEIQRKITKLPKYLTVHFVRFFWKRETGKKAKIMRKVQFPFQLDVMELVDEQKREGLIKARDEISKLEKTFDEEFRQIKKAKLTSELTSREQYESQMKEMKSIKEKRQEQFQDLFKTLDVSEGENASSLYDLQGIIAHQGASADSGHYQAFVRDPNDVSGEKWYKFNDDKVTVIDREKIISLAGGSEGDSALILIYKGVGM